MGGGLDLRPVEARLQLLRPVPQLGLVGLLERLLHQRLGGGLRDADGRREIVRLEGVGLPCAVMEEGDDAAAIEASLAENVARLPMDEIDQYRAFAALIAKGRKVDDIASRFGATERLVRQRLAIANLRPAILTLYRKEEIEADTMRALTLATKAQQAAWLKRWRDPADYAPRGRHLRQWLLGGEQIATSAALFPLDTYKGVIVADLFGEEAYFADTETFWALQDEAVAERAEAYQKRGWSDVVVLERGRHWSGYEHGKVSRKDGGKVFVAIASNGEVAFHHGYLTDDELRRRANAEQPKAADSAVRPELTKAAANYINLHRHASVRAALLKERGVALRLAVAHIVAGSRLWRVEAEPQRADKPETAKSLSESVGEAFMAAERQEVLTLLGLDADTPILAGHARGEIGSLFERLLTLEDADVLRVLALLMAETLEAGTPMIEMLGGMLGVSMGAWWDADDAFLPLIRDRETLLAMLAEIGGAAVASAHTASPAKTVRSIIRQYATGEGRPKVEGWVPRWLAFPAGSYRDDAVSLPKAA